MRSFIFAAAVGACTLGLGLTNSRADESPGAPATIRVTLPADAALTVDGQETQATSATRLFTTPPLETGKRYFYNFKVSFVRDGRTIAVEQKVWVRAGQESVVSLGLPGQQNYYYDPQSPAAASANVNYYYSPGSYPAAAPYYGGFFIPTTSITSQWQPGNYSIYNP